jgi:hypothetical protein
LRLQSAGDELDSIAACAAVLRRGRRICGAIREFVEEVNVDENLPPSVWVERCARRINQVDHEIAEAEARRLARELHRFERTRAMEPEAAVDFVAMALADPQRAPLERRRTNRV